MSGHSHWAGIKHKKGKEDEKRGKAFSKAAKKIMSAARRGGANPDTNLELQYAVEDAKSINMPKGNIERAILKGSGQLEGEKLESVRFEGYGRGGAAVMVDALTDNRNRTNPDVRKIFSKQGGRIGANGCVSWIFQTKGLMLVKLNDRSVEEIFDLVVEAGAEDFQEAGEVYELTCSIEDFQRVKDALGEAGIPYESAEITQVPTNYVDLDASDGRRILSLMEELEDHEDVENVYSNFNLPREMVQELEQQ